MCGSSASRLYLVAMAAGLFLGAGCSGSTSAPPEEAASGPPSFEVDENSAKVPLLEASGIVVRGGGKVAVICGDETSGRLFGVSLDDFSRRWEIVFPPRQPMTDIESLAPWGENGVVVCCSLSRTKPKDKIKPERDRIALVSLSDDARRTTQEVVHENLRDPLIGHLLTSLAGRIDKPAAVSDAPPPDGGLNVEGIAMWKGRLLLGLRSPTVSGGGAIVVPIERPERLFERGGAGQPEFGKPIIMSTKPGEGIRDMTADGDSVLVILGPPGEGREPPFRIVRWNPDTNQVVPVHVKGFKKVGKPEGIAVDPQGRVLICQDLVPPYKKPVLFRLEITKDEADEPEAEK